MNLENIIEIVCREYELSPGTIQLKTRVEGIREARQVIHYFARKKTSLTCFSIGIIVGMKDHATVLHSCKTVKNLMQFDKEYKAKIERIEAKIELFGKEPENWLDQLIFMIWDKWYFLKVN